MKKFTIVIFICFVINFNRIPAQWIQLNSGTGASLNGLFVLNPTTGFIAGKPHLKTTDSGISWTQGTTTSSYINDVYFTNSQIGIMVGWQTTFMSDFSQIWRSIDGGSNWTLLSTNFGWTCLTSVCFPSENIGYAAGYNEGHSNFPFLKTTTGGLSWYPLSIPSDEYKFLYDVFFINETTGFITTWFINGIIGKTTNGGVNWNTVYSGSNDLISIVFCNDTTGYACGENGVILKTTNSGANWTSGQQGSLYLNCIFFQNPLTGYVAGDQGKIYRTTNGASSWEPQASGTTQHLNAIQFVNSSTGFCVGGGGTILKTTNGGIIAINQISSEIPHEYILHQNFPNPFNPVTNIKYQIRESGIVKLVVYDILGREISVLVNENQRAGIYRTDWNAENMPSGIYYYKLTTGDYSETKKMLLLK